MKKHVFKSFALLAMLFSTLTMSAISYCGETITATDGTTAVITCTQPEAGTYVMTISSTQTGFSGLKGINNYFLVDGSKTRATNTATGKITGNFDSSLRVLTLTFACTDVPVMNSPLYLNFSAQEKQFDALNGQEFEWPTSCEAGSEEPEETGAIDWSSVDWVAGSDNKYKVYHECLSNVINVQKPGWAAENGIYVTTPGAITNCTVNGARDGAGIVLYLSSFTAKVTEVTINYEGGSCTFWVYYADGSGDAGGSGDSGDSGDSQDPDLPIPSTGPSDVNWESYDWVPKNQCETCENQYKVETNGGCVKSAENIQDRNQNMSIYCVTAKVVADCNIGYTPSAGTEIWLHLSDLTSRETEVTLKFADGTTCSFWVLNDKAEPADDPSQPVGDGVCTYEGIVGDGQTAGAGDLKIPFDEGYVVTLELNEDKTQLNIQLQLKEKDIENADRAYFLNYPDYDITKTIIHHELTKSSTVPGLYTRSLPINQGYISNYEKGIILFAIKVDYPNHPIKVTLPEYFRLDGSDCPPRVFTVYHHDDFPSTEEESEYMCTQFNGGVIYQPIQYKRILRPDSWETLSIPFDVDSVTVYDPATGTSYLMQARYYDTNGNIVEGHYWLRYFKTEEVTSSEFQPNWYDINATSAENAKPEKDKAYIIRVPAGDFYINKYLVFHGRGYQTIASEYNVPELPEEDGYYSYSGNNTMMPQLLISAYVLNTQGTYFQSDEQVKLYPFECSVNATAATIARMPRISLNDRERTVTDVENLPTTDLSDGVIYTVYGAAVAEFHSLEQYDEARAQLPAGVYVVATPTAIIKIQLINR